MFGSGTTERIVNDTTHFVNKIHFSHNVWLKTHKSDLFFEMCPVSFFWDKESTQLVAFCEIFSEGGVWFWEDCILKSHKNESLPHKSQGLKSQGLKSQGLKSQGLKI